MENFTSVVLRVQTQNQEIVWNNLIKFENLIKCEEDNSLYGEQIDLNELITQIQVKTYIYEYYINKNGNEYIDIQFEINSEVWYENKDRIIEYFKEQNCIVSGQFAEENMFFTGIIDNNNITMQENEEADEEVFMECWGFYPPTDEW